MDNSKTILIIEDADDIRTALCEILEIDQYKILTATNGQDGIDVLAGSEKPALIFLDIRMPIMNGLEFLRILRGSVNFSSIPVVVMSASANITEVEGANAFLKKPFDMDTVLQMAKDFCYSKRLTFELV